jgi:hypothetical protein
VHAALVLFAALLAQQGNTNASPAENPTLAAQQPRTTTITAQPSLSRRGGESAAERALQLRRDLARLSEVTARLQALEANATPNTYPAEALKLAAEIAQLGKRIRAEVKQQ